MMPVAPGGIEAARRLFQGSVAVEERLGIRVAPIMEHVRIAKLGEGGGRVAIEAAAADCERYRERWGKTMPGVKAAAVAGIMRPPRAPSAPPAIGRCVRCRLLRLRLVCHCTPKHHHARCHAWHTRCHHNGRVSHETRCACVCFPRVQLAAGRPPSTASPRGALRTSQRACVPGSMPTPAVATASCLRPRSGKRLRSPRPTHGSLPAFGGLGRSTAMAGSRRRPTGRRRCSGARTCCAPKCARCCGRSQWSRMGRSQSSRTASTWASMTSRPSSGWCIGRTPTSLGCAPAGPVTMTMTMTMMTVGQMEVKLMYRPTPNGHALRSCTVGH